ncbi:MAG: putative E3 ubiquitin-protein ligase PRT6 [Streblomastix strix]|uniref:E3 ubiquitin-protein ligase n=1 Tax=Streblomastix strix TaxID=222440 RepID=A0A5J4X5U9_9EUKA|nr:MAG: putative E3 ubiquitin-protein ligase PRT6 [Streblomastix strix]
MNLALIDKFLEDAINKDDIKTVNFVELLVFALGTKPKSTLERIKKASFQSESVCSRVWADGDRAYKCTTCQIDSTSALCEDCFEIDLHKNHDYTLIETGGGTCDCGKACSWNVNSFCRHHARNAKQCDPLSSLKPASLKN